MTQVAVPQELLCLNAYAEKNPPKEPWVARESEQIYLQPWTRLVLHWEHTPDLAYGLARGAELGAQHNIFDADLDSKAFADKLVAFLGPSLSIHDLEQLVAAFSAELARENARRDAAIARHAQSEAETPARP